MRTYCHSRAIRLTVFYSNLGSIREWIRRKLGQQSLHAINTFRANGIVIREHGILSSTGMMLSNDIFFSNYCQRPAFRRRWVCSSSSFYAQNPIGCRNFSPDLPGPGQVNVYWWASQHLIPQHHSLTKGSGDSYAQGSNSWAQVQSIYYTFHEAVAFSNPLCLAEVSFHVCSSVCHRNVRLSLAEVFSWTGVKSL